MNRTIVETIIRSNLFRDKVTIFPISFMLQSILSFERRNRGLFEIMFHRGLHTSFVDYVRLEILDVATR